MINSLRKMSLFITIVFFSHLDSDAQSNITKYELGAGLSAFIYQGDLTPSRFGSFKTLRPGINLYAAKVLGRSFSVRANLAIGGLKGDDAKYNSPEFRKQRAFTFHSPVMELSALLVWNPLGKNYADKGLSPYFFGGPGLSLLHIKRDWSRFNTDYFGDASDVPARLVQDQQHGVPRVIPVIAAGAGMRYDISSRLAVSLEESYRFTYTDYLDGFSKAVNAEKNDHYHTITAGLIYRIGKKNSMDCPVLKY